MKNYRSLQCRATFSGGWETVLDALIAQHHARLLIVSDDKSKSPAITLGVGSISH